MLTFKRNPRSSVPEPRSGEDLVLLPLDADEVIVEQKPQITRFEATAVLVCVAMLAGYLFKDPVSPIKSPSRTPLLQPGEAQQVEKIPQPLELSSELALPVPKLPKVTDSSYQAIPTAPDSLVGPSSVTSATAPVSDHLKERAARPVKPSDSALWVEPEAPRRHADAEQQRKAERPSTTITPPPAKATEGVTSNQLRRTKEKLAELTALIAKEDFATAVNNAITFRDKNPGLVDSASNEYCALLKLQRTATEKYFSSPSTSGRRPSYDTGDLDVAVIDHDLMLAYLHGGKPTFAREHFLNAERGYNRTLSAARQRERTGSGGPSAKRDIQQVAENLGLLYVAWADDKPDASVLQKAEASFWDSEKLVDYAEDRASAKRSLMNGKAWAERTRRRLP